MSKNPHIFIIAGPNGAGKTTSAASLLPDFLKCEEYVNADGIAAGLSQFKPEAVALGAGRVMISRIHELIKQRKSFAFETTLSSRSFVSLLKECKREGYSTSILFLWLQSPALAIKRVALRVSKGGHSIPEETIVRRYKKGLQNLFRLYMPIINNWSLLDNSYKNPELIAKKAETDEIAIRNEPVWLKIREQIK